MKSHNNNKFVFLHEAPHSESCCIEKFYKQLPASKSVINYRTADRWTQKKNEKISENLENKSVVNLCFNSIDKRATFQHCLFYVKLPMNIIYFQHCWVW